MSKALTAFPTASVALRTLGKLRKEVSSAKTFQELDAAARTASIIQKAFKPVREVADEAGEVWTMALIRLAAELKKVPKAKGTRGNISGKQAGTGKGKGKGKGKTKAVTSGGSDSEPPEEVTLADMGVSRRQASQARALDKIPTDKHRAYIAQLKAAGKDITPTNIIKLHKEAMRLERRDEYLSRVQSGGTIDDLQTLVREGKKFSVIYADPPWQFNVYSGEGKDRSADRHFDTMSLEQIAALPVPDLAAQDCVLLMWGVWPEMPGALATVTAWGFEYKTCGFLYVKQNKSGNGIFTGLGYWTRANTEPCLLATRGSPERLEKDVKQVVLAPVGRHSEKPDEVHDRIERFLPGPYIELFARAPRKGWTTWGNEI
jgi:N6-adenosine-specific RNA methylase IME4